LIYTMAQTTIQLLNKLFNDPKTGYVGTDKLLRRAKEQNAKITMKQVKEFLAQNPISQVFQKPKNSKSVPKIHGKLGHYQADRSFLTRYQRQNSNYHILLVVIKSTQSMHMSLHGRIKRKKQKRWTFFESSTNR
jgi:hypothetical protein